MKKRFTRRDHVYKYPTVNADSFDKRRFNELLFMSKGLQKVRQTGEKQPYFDQLMGDIWSSFYKNKPQLLEIEEISPELSMNYQLMNRVLSDELFAETHEYTKLDDLHSALSTVGFSEKIFEWLEKQVDSNQDMQNAFENLMQQQEKHGQNSQQFQEAMKNFSDALSDQLENNNPDFTQMLKESIEETKQTEKNLQNLLSGIEAGKVSNNEMKQMPLREQFALADYLRTNYKMRRIAEWAGRFKAIAQSKQKSISKESISRSGVTNGNDIDRILPNEMLNLSNPATKLDFLKRFAEGQTLQYATKGKQTLGKGSIILCLDQSGSMEQLDEQSKGFALALMSIAKRQKRDFALITFDTRTKTKQYPKGNISTSQMVDLCEHFMGGGTEFFRPLSESLKLIRGSRFKNADIIFVTDGEDSLSRQFLINFRKEKEKLGFSVLSLLIGNEADRNTVRAFSDEIYHSSDFADENAHEIFKI